MMLSKMDPTTILPSDESTTMLPGKDSTTETLTVVCIPADGSDIHLRTFALFDIGSETFSEAECNTIEKELKHIPNMKSIHEPGAFSWEKRRLYSRPNEGSCRESWNADHMMYTCSDGSDGLPRNSYLVDVQDGYPEYIRVNVYGDAFVFKKKFSAKHERTEYIDMDEDFVKEAKDGYALWILKSLLNFPSARA